MPLHDSRFVFAGYQVGQSSVPLEEKFRVAAEFWHRLGDVGLRALQVRNDEVPGLSAQHLADAAREQGVTSFGGGLVL
jgi:hypothetical protein